jgi:hypothetical protein
VQKDRYTLWFQILIILPEHEFPKETSVVSCLVIFIRNVFFFEELLETKILYFFNTRGYFESENSEGGPVRLYSDETMNCEQVAAMNN